MLNHAYPYTQEKTCGKTSFEEIIWPWVNTNPFGVGEFTTHFRTYFSGWIGMFTRGTIGVLTHSHVMFLGGSQPSPLLFSLLVFSGGFHVTH